MISRIWSRSLFAGVAAAGALAMSPAIAQDAPTVKVGVVAFYTGAAAGPFGIPARNGAELVINAINDGSLPAPYNNKGAGGVAIEPVYVDESGGTTKTVTDLRNMVQRQGVESVVGYISSGSCLAAAPVAEELKTFTILFDCGTPRIFEENDYRYVFRTISHSITDSVAAARYVLADMKNVKSYQGINQNYAWGQDSWRDFQAAMQVLAPKATDKDTLYPKLFQGQYDAEISKLSVSKADVVHSSLWGGDVESFILQAAARGLNKQTKLVLTTGETAMFRLRGQMPDGLILGGRGPYGVMARDTELNRWFRKNYEDKYATPPTYPAYQMAQAVLALKVAYDEAAKKSGGAKPTSEQAADALVGKTYEAFGTTVKLALGKGHQAITEAAYGKFKYDKKTGTPTLVDVRYFPAECVNPPEGVNSVDWIKGGMQGAKC